VSGNNGSQEPLHGMTGPRAAGAWAVDGMRLSRARQFLESSTSAERGPRWPPIRPPASIAGTGPQDHQVARPQLLCEVVIVAGLLFVYDRVAELVAAHRASADSHGFSLLGAEHHLHLAVERGLNTWVVGHRALNLLAVGYYQLMHLGAALTILVWCYLRRPQVYRPARNALVAINLIGLTVFVLYPVAPPRSLPQAGFVDSVATEWSVHAPPDHFGALPSLHLAWAAWACLVGVAVVAQPALRLLLFLHPILTAVVVLATANHYLIDVAAGVALGLAVTAAARSWPRAQCSPDLMKARQV
jgi:PAP2 superfamily protein